jgi:hypothetical protein
MPSLSKHILQINLLTASWPRLLAVMLADAVLPLVSLRIATIDPQIQKPNDECG